MQSHPFGRITTSFILVTTFAFAPIANVVGVAHVLPSVAHAEAQIPSGVISGNVSLHDYGTGLDSALAGQTVELKLDLNDTKVQELVTDPSGNYSFSAPSSDYKVCVVPGATHALYPQSPTKTTCALVQWVEGGFVTPVVDYILITRPVVTPNGANPLTLTVGDVYVEAGASASRDGIVISDNIQPQDQTVDTSVAGDTTLTYSYFEKQSGLFEASTRVVHVVAKSVGTVIGSYTNAVAPNPVQPKGEVLGISTESGPVMIGLSAPKLLNTFMSSTTAPDKKDIIRLQVFLFQEEGLMNMRATGVYDAETERGVRIFQDRHFDEVMSPWGIDGNTGKVYLTTQKKINELYAHTKFPLSAREESEVLAYKLALTAGRNHSNALPVGVSTVDTTDATAASAKSDWWKRAKQNLVAAFPIFKTKEKAEVTSASGSLTTNIDKVDPVVEGRRGNIATAFFNFRNFMNMSTLAIFFSVLVGVLAFGSALYLYHRTREEEVVEVVSKASVPKDVKKIK